MILFDRKIPLIFLKSDGITSSSNGKYPDNIANSITPELHVSISVPQYNLWKK